MQSWGTYSRFSERDSGKEPSKSGVIGLLCAALGRPRHADLSDLASLRMAVRVDREGVFSKDFQTALNVPRAGNPGDSTVISNRYYLADACFLVALDGDRDLIASLRASLDVPHWELFLGRRSFVPSAPILIDGTESFEDARTAIRSFKWIGRRDTRRPDSLRAVVECGAGEGETRMDVPISFERREFALRHVMTEWIATAGLSEA